MNLVSLTDQLLSAIGDIPVFVLIVFDMFTLFSILLLVSRIPVALAKRFVSCHSWQAGCMEAALSTALTLALMHGKPGFLIKELVVTWQAPFPFTAIVQFIAVVWGLGMLLSVLQLLRQNRRFALYVKGAAEASTDPAYLTACLKASASGVSCKILTGLSAPGVFGMKQPVILIPENFTETYTEEERYLIYLHELSHIRSQDCAVYAVIRFLRAVFYLHLPVKSLLDILELSLEQRCDQQVLQLTAAPVQYGELLLHAAKNRTTVPVSFSCRSCNMAARRMEALFFQRKGGKLQLLPRMIFCLLTICCLLYPLTPKMYTFGPSMAFAAQLPDQQLESIPVSSREEAVSIMNENPDVYTKPSFVQTKWEGMFAIYTKGETLEL